MKLRVTTYMQLTPSCVGRTTITCVDTFFQLGFKVVKVMKTMISICFFYFHLTWTKFIQFFLFFLFIYLESVSDQKKVVL